jgi:hypothetical protein
MDKEILKRMRLSTIQERSPSRKHSEHKPFGAIQTFSSLLGRGIVALKAN